jgi:hypothetical protein
MTCSSSEETGVSAGSLYSSTESVHVPVAAGIQPLENASDDNVLDFTEDGVCRIVLKGLPQPEELEELVGEYVSKVELLPYRLKVVLLDISELIHMKAQVRQIFSELLLQASRHYAEKVHVVIAGGPPMIRKYTEILCKALKFRNRTHSFDSLQAAKKWLKENPGES